MKIRELPKSVGAEVSGDYRVLWTSSLIARNKVSYVKFGLEDPSGTIKGYGWEGTYQGPTVPAPGSLLRVKGFMRTIDGNWFINMLEANPLDPNGASPLLLIPRKACPNPEDFHKLWELANTLSGGPFACFIDSVFRDGKLALGLVSAPASLNHHHSFPGGLLAHSLESENIIRGIPGMKPHAQEAARVAALLHDVGKTRTLTSGMKRTNSGRVLDHDVLTLEVLAPHLAVLDCTWPDGGLMLRYILSWKQQRTHRGWSPLLAAAEAVSAADRLSTGLNCEDVAFKSAEDWQRFSRLGPRCLYWRPKAPPGRSVGTETSNADSDVA